MSRKLHYAFTCPKCGFHGWGTSNCDKPFDQWFGHCNASGCGFSWHRETADQVYLKESTPTRINQTMMTKEESLELASKHNAKRYTDLPGAFPGKSIVVFAVDDFLAYTSAIEEKYQAQIEALRLELDTANMLVKMRPAPYADTDAGLVKQVQEHQAQIAGMRQALLAARMFIKNGVEFGFIRMPESDCLDSAHNTLPMIEKALSATQATADAWEAEVKARAQAEERANFIQVLLAVARSGGALGLLDHLEDRARRGEMFFANGKHVTGVMATELRNQQPEGNRK